MIYKKALDHVNILDCYLLHNVCEADLNMNN